MGIAITLEEYLKDHHVDYDLITHKISHSSSETAQIGHIPGKQLAKAVLLEDQAGDYLIAVLPSDRRVDLAAVGKSLNRRVGLATENTLPLIFADCELGAVPALAQAYGIPVLVDESLQMQPDIYFEGGNHEDVVHIEGNDFNELMYEELHCSFSRPMK